MSKPNNRNPYDVLYELVGACETLEERIGKVRSLLEYGRIDVELNATLLAEAMDMPMLAVQNMQFAKALKDAMSKLESLPSQLLTPLGCGLVMLQCNH